MRENTDSCSAPEVTLIGPIRLFWRGKQLTAPNGFWAGRVRLRVLIDSINIVVVVFLFCMLACLVLYPARIINAPIAFKLGCYPAGFCVLYARTVFYRRSKARFGAWLASNDHQVCIECGYLLTHLPDKYTCPECGADYEKSALVGLWLEWRNGHASALRRPYETAKAGSQHGERT